MLKEKWKTIEKEQKFILANLVQVPSYISLMTALDYYEITTQVQRNFIESVAVKRTKEIEIEGTIFNYTKVNKSFYSGFSREREFFIATPEKAFMDAVYLRSLGRYNFDLASIDSNKLNMDEMVRLANQFPRKTQKMLTDNDYFRKA